jgi:hypothetical protein
MQTRRESIGCPLAKRDICQDTRRAVSRTWEKGRASARPSKDGPAHGGAGTTPPVFNELFDYAKSRSSNMRKASKMANEQ